MNEDNVTRDSGLGTRKEFGLGRVSCLVSRVSIAAAALALSACSGIEPWVKPYERAALAESIMAASRDPVADEYMHHVYEVREGARGASGSAGGGCGCN